MRIKENWTMVKENEENDNSRNFSALDASVHSGDVSNSNIGIVNEIRRGKAKQTVLSIITKNEVLGAEEIIKNLPRREYSMQVTSKSLTYLKLDAKDFREKFFTANSHWNHAMCEKLDI